MNHVSHIFKKKKKKSPFRSRPLCCYGFLTFKNVTLSSAERQSAFLLLVFCDFVTGKDEDE